MENRKDSYITEVVEKDLFTVEKVLFKFISARENQNTDAPKLQVSHMSMAEIAV